MILAAQGRGLCARGRFGIRGRPACLCGACTRVCARPAPLAPAYLSNPAIPRRRHPSKHGESTAPFRSGAPRPLQVPRSILNSSVVPRPLPGRCLPLPFRKSQPLLPKPARYTVTAADVLKIPAAKAHSIPSLVAQLFFLSPRLRANEMVEGPNHSSPGRRRAA